MKKLLSLEQLTRRKPVSVICFPNTEFSMDPSSMPPGLATVNGDDEGVVPLVDSVAEAPCKDHQPQVRIFFADVNTINSCN